MLSIVRLHLIYNLTSTSGSVMFYSLNVLFCEQCSEEMFPLAFLTFYFKEPSRLVIVLFLVFVIPVEI